MENKVFVVVYRVGGTVNFQWQRTVKFTTREEATLAAASIRRGGRPALVVDADRSKRIGLPETFDMYDGPRS